MREERASAIGMVSKQLVAPTKPTMIYPSRDLRRRLELEAAKQKTTLTAMCCELLELALAQRRK